MTPGELIKGAFIPARDGGIVTYTVTHGFAPLVRIIRTDGAHRVMETWFPVHPVASEGGIGFKCGHDTRYGIDASYHGDIPNGVWIETFETKAQIGFDDIGDDEADEVVAKWMLTNSVTANELDLRNAAMLFVIYSMFLPETRRAHWEGRAVNDEVRTLDGYWNFNVPRPFPLSTSREDAAIANSFLAAAEWRRTLGA